MKYIVLFLLLFLCFQALRAQEEQMAYRKQIGLSIGLNQGYLQDDNYSSLQYKEGGRMYGLDYNSRNKNNKQLFFAHIDFGTGQLKTSANDQFTSDYILANVELGYLYPINRGFKNPKFDLSLGGQYHFNIDYLEWLDQESISFFARHSLGLTARVHYTPSQKHHFQLGLSVPILSQLIRPPFSGESVELQQAGPIQLITQGSLGTFNKLLAYKLSVAYSYQLSDRWDLAINYTNQYVHLKEVKPLKLLRNQLTFGFVRHF